MPSKSGSTNIISSILPKSTSKPKVNSSSLFQDDLFSNTASSDPFSAKLKSPPPKTQTPVDEQPSNQGEVDDLDLDIPEDIFGGDVLVEEISFADVVQETPVPKEEVTTPVLAPSEPTTSTPKSSTPSISVPVPSKPAASAPKSNPLDFDADLFGDKTAKKSAKPTVSLFDKSDSLGNILNNDSVAPVVTKSKPVANSDSLFNDSIFSRSPAKPSPISSASEKKDLFDDSFFTGFFIFCFLFTIFPNFLKYRSDEETSSIVSTTNQHY